MTVTQGVPSHLVWKIAHMPSSTLDYWVRTKLVQPKYRRSEGKRVERWWSIRDVVVVCALRALRQAGASLQVLRRAAKQLELWDEPLAISRLVWDGTDLVMIESENQALSLVSQPGQGVLLRMSLPLGEWESSAERAASVLDLDAFRERARERRKQQRLYVVPTEPAIQTAESSR